MKLNYQFKPAVRGDLPKMAALDAANADGWSQDQIACTDHDTHRSRFVVRGEGFAVYAYAIYEVQDRVVRLIRLAVDPRLARSGIGKYLLDEIKRSAGKKNRVLLSSIPVDNLQAIQFFSSQGFRATKEAVIASDKSDDDSPVRVYQMILQLAARKIADPIVDFQQRLQWSPRDLSNHSEDAD